MLFEGMKHSLVQSSIKEPDDNGCCRCCRMIVSCGITEVILPRDAIVRKQGRSPIYFF